MPVQDKIFEQVPSDKLSTFVSREPNSKVVQALVEPSEPDEVRLTGDALRSAPRTAAGIDLAPAGACMRNRISAE